MSIRTRWGLIKGGTPGPLQGGTLGGELYLSMSRDIGNFWPADKFLSRAATCIFRELARSTYSDFGSQFLQLSSPGSRLVTGENSSEFRVITANIPKAEAKMTEPTLGVSKTS